MLSSTSTISVGDVVKLFDHLALVAPGGRVGDEFEERVGEDRLVYLEADEAWRVHGRSSARAPPETLVRPA